MSPTCIAPSSTPCPPAQMIKTVIPFIINISAGIIILIARLTNILAFIRSKFALSNLSSSVFSLLNALITGSPVNISRATPFNLSINSCNFLNLGIAIINKVITTKIITTIARPIIQAIEFALLARTLKNPPIPIIGA